MGSLHIFLMDSCRIPIQIFALAGPLGGGFKSVCATQQQPGSEDTSEMFICVESPRDFTQRAQPPPEDCTTQITPTRD